MLLRLLKRLFKSKIKSKKDNFILRKYCSGCDSIQVHHHSPFEDPFCYRCYGRQHGY